MRRITSAVLRHRLAVTISWIALTAIGGLLVGSANRGLSHTLATPGLAGYDANQKILRTFGLDGGEAPVLAVLHLPAGMTMTTPAGRTAAERTFAAASRRMHVGLVDYATSADRRLMSADGTSTWAFYDMPNPDAGAYTNTINEIEPVLKKAAPAGSTLTLTGNEALQSTSSHGGGGGLSTLQETLIGAAAALLVLAFVYGSAIAVLPLLMALPSILTTFLMLYGLEQLTSVSSLVQYLVAFIGLGIAIDYSLLIVTRWREERERGVSDEEAILAAAEHAGGAVLLSGLTVAVGMLSLLIIPVQFLRGIGLGSLLIPVAAVLTATTLLPVLLSAWGPTLDRRRFRKGSTTYSRAWERWASLMIRRRWIAGAGGLAIMVALAIPALSINTGQPSAGSLGGNTPAAHALHALQREGVPQAVTFPIQVMAPSAAASEAAAIGRSTNGVWGVYQPQLPAGSKGARTLLSVIPEAAGNASAGIDTVKRLRAALTRRDRRTLVGGDTAANIDFSSAIYGNFPIMLAVIALITFVLLARSFRSVALAAKAVALNVISLGASYGFIVLFWQEGHGSNLLYGVSATHAIRNWAPVIMFAFLFGISMDYEVFVLARMREEFDATKDTRTAIVHALGRTGRLITCAALILGISFASLSTTNDIAVQVPATGLAVGVVLDALVVRTLLVPALAALLGRWNWWLPAGLARLLGVEPAPMSRA